METSAKTAQNVNELFYEIGECRDSCTLQPGWLLISDNLTISILCSKETGKCKPIKSEWDYAEQRSTRTEEKASLLLRMTMLVWFRHHLAMTMRNNAGRFFRWWFVYITYLPVDIFFPVYFPLSAGICKVHPHCFQFINVCMWINNLSRIQLIKRERILKPTSERQFWYRFSKPKHRMSCFRQVGLCLIRGRALIIMSFPYIRDSHRDGKFNPILVFHYRIDFQTSIYPLDDIRSADTATWPPTDEGRWRVRVWASAVQADQLDRLDRLQRLADSHSGQIESVAVDSYTQAEEVEVYKYINKYIYCILASPSFLSIRFRIPAICMT